MASVRPVHAADWPALAARFRDFSYEQSAAWSIPAAVRVGAETRFLSIEKDGRVTAATAVRIKRVPGLGRGIAWIASGPLMLPLDGPAPSEAEVAEILVALRAELADRQGHILRLRPSPLNRRAPEDWVRIAARAGFGPTDRAATYRSFAVDLSKDDDVLMRDLHAKWRGHLRKALKSGLEIEHGKPTERNLAARFRTLYDDVREAKGFGSALAPEFFFDLEGSDFEHEILMATLHGGDAAGIVIGASGGISVYLFGATGAAGRPSRAGYLLTWEGIRRARAQGRAWYDLGGVNEAENPDVHHFKARVGGVPFDAPGPFEAKPTGPTARIVERLESLHVHLRGLRR